jgi:hypothetical protein
MAPDREPADVPPYWFAAKTYGWGWGMPLTWQGWAVMLAYLGSILAAVRFMPPEKSLPNFLAGVIVPTAVLIAICWWKGEPPRWRWG